MNSGPLEVQQVFYWVDYQASAIFNSYGELTEHYPCWPDTQAT